MKMTDVPLSKIDQKSIRVMGLNRTRSSYSFNEEAFIQMIEHRIPTDGDYPANIMSHEESEYLDSIGVEANVRFELKERDATLADDVIFKTSKNSIIEPKMEDKLTTLVRNAHKFVLTEDAAIKVGTAIRQYPEMLVEHGIFAQTPFPTCWIEMPSYAFHEAVVPNSSSETADIRVGYLFHNNKVYVAAQNNESDSPEWSPMCYHLHSPLSMAQEIDIATELHISRGQLNVVYWGGTMASELPFETVRKLRSQHGFSMILNKKFRGKIGGMDWLGFSAGEMRNIIGLLLMLNQPSSILRLETVPNSRRVTAKGNRVLMAHSTITINLDRRSTVRKLVSLPDNIIKMAPRWHEVADHWCTNNVAKMALAHEHVWVQDDDGSLKFTCSVCHGRRWRRVMKNGRGDRARGTVSQDRKVEA